MHAWEIHPALVHFPLALLLAGFVADAVGRVTRRQLLARAGVGLLIAGVLTGLIAAGTGALAYFTVPAHTEAGHRDMDVHLLAASAALVLFAFVAVSRWRRRDRPASAAALSGGLLASALLIGAAFLGGKAVYHGGAGVAPEILAPEIAQGHHHHHGDQADEDAPKVPDHEGDASKRGEPIAEAHPHVHDDHQQLHARPNDAHDRQALFDPDEDLTTAPAR